MSALVAIGYPDETTGSAAAEAHRLAAEVIVEPEAIAVQPARLVPADMSSDSERRELALIEQGLGEDTRLAASPRRRPVPTRATS